MVSRQLARRFPRQARGCESCLIPPRTSNIPPWLALIISAGDGLPIAAEREIFLVRSRIPRSPVACPSPVLPWRAGPFGVLRRAGVEAELNVYEGMSHAQYNFDPYAPETKEVFTEIARFFDKHLGK